jgi:D-alanine-D-alanine ligase
LFSRSAVAAGFTHASLIETIVAESMLRQIAPAAQRNAA